MDIKVERSQPCIVAFTATVTPDEVAEERERVVATWMRGVRVPGFRKGKAPRAMVERRYAEEIAADVQENLLHHVWREVRAQGALRPASEQISIDGRFEDGGEFSVKGEVEAYPVVEIASLEGFVAPPFELEPTEQEIDKSLARLRERQGTWEPLENGTVADGVLVEAEVHGQLADGDAAPFHDERSLFRVGAGEVFPEIEAAVRGHAVGDEVSAERVLGEEAGEQSGARIGYRIVIKSLRRQQLPELDDAFAQSLGVEDGLAALRERVAMQITLEKAHLRRDVWRAALVRHLAGDRQLNLPETVVREETRKEVIGFAQSLAGHGVDPEKADLDWAKLHDEARQRVEERLRAELFLDAMAEVHVVEVSDEDVDGELERQAKRMRVPFAELKGNLAKGGGFERVRAMLRREKAVDEVLARQAAPSGDGGEE